MNKKLTIPVITLCLSFCFNTGFTQGDDVIASTKTGMKSGSVETISQYFNDLVEINFNDEKSSYNKQQAEGVLSDFFAKYPATDFQYVHRGSSPEGLQFAIATYSYRGGKFRVFMLIKKKQGKHIIDMLDIGNE
ncbi:DUF4783 domain-containing protein [Flammeovirgaceae bacterium SG7u.111]|nr:DUF4783 domain-containing protein [Flammeovirgaceae bacterium SG7u.132]WPO36223.1 DUF4783 domain-containing protein [Flammeovirgaceae bacterium SG7u.111]